MKNKKKTNMIPVKTVTTISGRVCSKSECKLIEGEYYKIGDPTVENSGDCYFMESSSKYVRITSDLIIYDHNVKKYVYRNTKSFHKGVVEITENGEVNLGHFTYKRLYLLPQLITPEGNKYYCVNDELLNNQNFYKESFADGIFYHKSTKKASVFSKKVYCSQDEKRNLSYSVDADLIKSNKTSHKEGFDYPINSFIKDQGSFAKDFTFGLEFETVKGVIPSRICRKLGLIPLRDGSINGLEFVTIPLQGDVGLQTVVECTKELHKRTEINSECSLHLHIGGVPRTEKYFLAVYKTLFLLQDEIFKMFPIYKKDNRGLKRKHYTKPFDYKDVLLMLDKKITKDNITENFNHLFKYLSMGKDYNTYDNKLKNVTCHPSDPRGQAKWNIKSRYHWVNLIPLLFGNKQTIEFRVHTATHHYGKILLFMAICMAILKYVMKYQDDILSNPKTLRNIRLYDVMIAVNMPNHILGLIHDYTKDRQYYVNNQLKKGIVMPSEEDFYCNSSNMILNYGNIYKDSTSKPDPFAVYQPPARDDIDIVFGDNEPNRDAREIILRGHRNVLRQFGLNNQNDLDVNVGNFHDVVREVQNNNQND